MYLGKDTLTTKLGQLFENRKESGKRGLPVLSVTMESGLVLRETIDRKMAHDLPPEQNLLVEPGDIAYNMMRMWQGAVAICTQKGVVSPAYVVCKPRDGIDSLFAFYFFKTHPILYRLKSYSFGITGDRLRLYFKDFASIRVSIPATSVQKKIAEILSTWDKAIEQTRKLIDAKNRRKRALMQQLLNRGRSLRNGYGGDEWRVKNIGELVKPVSRPVSKPKEQYLSIGIRSHGKGTFQKIVEQPEKVMMDTLYRVEPKDLIVNITFAWEGAAAIATEKDAGGLVSHRFPTYRFIEKEADINFFQSFILTKKFVWDLGLISPGGAGRNRVMSQKDFLKLRVFIPGIETQRKIGKILAAADNEIKLLESYLNALEKQKRGLMQKLLTGEIRVKT